MSLAVFDIEKYVDGFGNVVEPEIHYSDGVIRRVLHNVKDLSPDVPFLARCYSCLYSNFSVGCWFLSPLLTDISHSHPAPFKYTIRPRSEKTAALIASVEL